MRNLKFRYTFRRKNDGHIYMIIVPIRVLENGHGKIFSMLANDSWELIAREQFTDLYDRDGQEIYEGDRIRFYPRISVKGSFQRATWDGTVIIEDGVPTVSILDAKQVQNPENWDQTHDWIKSRSWACQVGYGEWETWNCPRRPLTQIHNGWEDYDQMETLFKRYGYGKRYINAEVIGTIHDEVT